MKQIKSVSFPQGNRFEGSPCIITYVDGSTERTIADTAYQRASERGLTSDQMKQIGL